VNQGNISASAKFDPMAEAEKDWTAKQRVAGLIEREQYATAKIAAALRQLPEQEERLAFNSADERDKSPIEAALDNLQYATHLLESCIGELSRRLEPVSLPFVPIVGNERKPASSPMEEVILDRCDEVLGAHDRIRGIIGRLQL